MRAMLLCSSASSVTQSSSHRLSDPFAFFLDGGALYHSERQVACCMSNSTPKQMKTPHQIIKIPVLVSRRSLSVLFETTTRERKNTKIQFTIKKWKNACFFFVFFLLFRNSNTNLLVYHKHKVSVE